MHGLYIKIIDAQQAKMFKNYNYVKLRILQSNAAIWYNKTHNTKQLTPEYTNIQSNGSNACNSLRTRYCKFILCVSLTKEIKYYKMQGTYIKMLTHSLSLRNKTL
jgi:hypothetical protein